MVQALPLVCLARHGETVWSLSGQHTGLTDIALTERGERDARRLGDRLHDRRFAQVLTSPLQRAARTCALAGFGAVAEIDPDLVEGNYGQYEWAPQRRDPRRPAGLAALPRRLSGRRVAGGGGRARGPRGAARARGGGRRAAVLERALRAACPAANWTLVAWPQVQ